MSVSRPRKGSLQFVPLKRSRRKPVFNCFKEGAALSQIPVVKISMISYHHSDDSGLTRRIDPATIVELPVSLTLIRGYLGTKNYSLKDIRTKETPFISQFDVKFNFTKTKSQLARVVLTKKLLLTIGVSDEISLRSSSLFKGIAYVDVKGRTKGKGTQGIVKRRGTKIKKRKHYRTAKKRLIGSQGCFTPGITSWRTPMAGQQGNANRLVYNLKLLSTEYLGFKENYTNLKSKATLCSEKENYLVLKGCVPGPSKSILFIRRDFRK